MFLRFTFLGLSTLEKFKIALEQIIQTVKGQDNYGNRIFFLTFPVFLCGKMGKIIVPNGNFFFQFFQVQHFKGTMKFQIRAFIGVEKR